MAVSTSIKYPLGSPQEHIVMCESHDLLIDMICEDCDKFICGKCAKTDHRDHDWKTLTAAVTQRRRGLLSFLKKMKEEDLPGIDEKIEKIPQQITENKQLCDSELEKLQKHYDEIIARLVEIKKRHEQKLRDNLVKKNDQLNHVKSELEKKKRGIVDTVEFMEENNNTMSDYSLIDNHRELTRMLSELEVHTINCEHSVRFTRGVINDDLLESLVGKTLDIDHISVTQINSFQYGDEDIIVLETFSEDQCYVSEDESEYTEKVNKQGVKEQKFRIIPYDMCVNDTGDVYLTDSSDDSIGCLSLSGSVSTVTSTDPLVPLYHGQKLTFEFTPTDVVCDSLCNILVTEFNNKQIHLLSPDGKFLKFLLTDNEVKLPLLLSIHKSIQWVGYTEGLVKVFKYIV